MFRAGCARWSRSGTDRSSEAVQVEEYGEQYQQEVRALLPSVGSFERWWRAVAGVMPVVVPALMFAAAAVCRRGVPCWPYCGLMQTTHRSTTRYRPPAPQTVSCCPTPGHHPRGDAAHVEAPRDSVAPGQSVLTSTRCQPDANKPPCGAGGTMTQAAAQNLSRPHLVSTAHALILPPAGDGQGSVPADGVAAGSH